MTAHQYHSIMMMIFMFFGHYCFDHGKDDLGVVMAVSSVIHTVLAIIQW